jgi:hypothetical protein
MAKLINYGTYVVTRCSSGGPYNVRTDIPMGFGRLICSRIECYWGAHGSQPANAHHFIAYIRWVIIRLARSHSFKIFEIHYPCRWHYGDHHYILKGCSSGCNILNILDYERQVRATSGLLDLGISR